MCLTGIGIGILLACKDDCDNSHDSLSTLILTGLACGTILYVAFFEILERERSKATVGLLQWGLLVLGFLLILGLEVAGDVLYTFFIFVFPENNLFLSDSEATCA